jgi:phospholipid N-methyltransferase
VQTKDRVFFFYKFLCNPQRVGSITPSSKFLVEHMAKQVDWQHARSIVELGAGTGVLTQKIAEHKHPDCKVLIVERDLEMRKKLEQLYPDFHFSSNAADFYAQFRLLGMNQADGIFSGLPFANFSGEEQEKILSEIVQALKPNGEFIAFQYSLQMKRKLAEKFGRVRISFVPLNIPPAFVYRCGDFKK